MNSSLSAILSRQHIGPCAPSSFVGTCGAGGRYISFHEIYAAWRAEADRCREQGLPIPDGDKFRDRYAEADRVGEGIVL